jgi:hypothetical protein
MTVIGLYSLVPGSGKTTLAECLRGHGYRRLSFAAPLREMLATLMRWQGCPEREIKDALRGEGKEVPNAYLCGATPRHAMQTLGTDWGRQMIHRHIWVDAAGQGARYVRRRGKKVVFDDVRFLNEAELIRVNLGGIVIRIDRAGFAPPAWKHESEGQLADFVPDLVINNDADTAAGFVLKASEAIAAMGQRR